MSNGLLINVLSSEYVDSISKDYAIYTASMRALPYASDGLKPGQRIALYLMQNKSDKIKTISLAGEMISSNLYLHGDSSAADSIGKMAAPYQNNIPLINGHGTFGTKVKPDDISAPRYTYVKRSKATTEILYPDSDIIPMCENYDGSRLQPVHFLPIIPVVMLNGVSGIATGYSTDVLPRDFKELVKATKAALLGKKIPTLNPKYMYNDSTVIVEGAGKYTFVGKMNIIDTTTVKVTELPPGKLLEKFREHLDTLEENGKIKEYTDNSSDNIDVEIKFKRMDLAKLNEDKLIQLLKLYERKTERIVTIGFDNKNVREFSSINELLTEFVDFRFNFYIDRYVKLLEDAEYDLKYWKTLNSCFENDVGSYVKTLESKQDFLDLITVIAGEHGADASQKERIANLSVYQFASDYHDKCINKISEIEEEIKNYNNLLNDHSLIKDQYAKELDDLLKVKFDIKR